MEPTTALQQRVDEILTEIQAIRHDLHAHPELCFQEQRTAEKVQAYLERVGCQVKGGVAGTGVLALLGRGDGPTVALRADMDALPIEEANQLPYRSQHPGCMHACGHDGHTAILLGTACLLAQLQNNLPGQVKLIFQPAEEEGAGGQAMCQAGALTDPPVEAIFALHGWPGLGHGTIAIGKGAIMAATDTFRITARGQGTHAAKPHLGIDPIVLSARIIEGIQTIVSRARDPVDPVVITVSRIQGGTATNIIPEKVTMAGTIRTLNETTREWVRKQLVALVKGIAQTFGGDGEVELTAGYPVTINDGTMVDLVCEVGESFLGPGQVVEISQPSMGAEDFSYYLQQVPGAMFQLGLGPGIAPLHNPRFDFADEALKPGILMMSRLAVGYLERAVRSG